VGERSVLAGAEENQPRFRNRRGPTPKSATACPTIISDLCLLLKRRLGLDSSNSVSSEAGKTHLYMMS